MQKYGNFPKAVKNQDPQFATPKVMNDSQVKPITPSSRKSTIPDTPSRTITNITDVYKP